MSGKAEPARAKPCPICGRTADERYKPFCSSRCANIDLGRWLGERYRIPPEPDLEEDERPRQRSDEEQEGG